MKQFLDDVIANLPAFTKELTSVAAVLEGAAIPALEAFGGAVRAATDFLTKNQTKGGGEDVDYISMLQKRGSVDIAGEYQYGHQAGDERPGESYAKRQINWFKDAADELQYTSMRAFHMTVPATMQLQSGVEGRNAQMGLSADGKEIVSAVKEVVNALRDKNSPWTPNPGDIDY
jgi:hypothetical protein